MNCPICSHIVATGTFKTGYGEKPPFRRFRVQAVRGDRIIHHGDFDALEVARAAACGTEDVVILEREPFNVVECCQNCGARIPKKIRHFGDPWELCVQCARRE